MRFIKHDLSEKFDEIEIVPFFDTHFGSKACDYNLVRSRVKYVAEKENAFALIGGDICNTALKNSKSDVYEDTLTPREQLKLAIEIFEPIKEKILGIVDGNHERRIAKETSITLLEQLAVQLGCADVYDEVSTLIFVRFGYQRDAKKGSGGRKLCYSIYMTHGFGGGSTQGGNANSLSRLGDTIDADLIVAGHTHKGIEFPQGTWRVDAQNSSAYYKEQVCIRAGAPMGQEKYAEAWGSRPLSKRNTIAILDGHKKGITTVNKANW